MTGTELFLLGLGAVVALGWVYRCALRYGGPWADGLRWRAHRESLADFACGYREALLDEGRPVRIEEADERAAEAFRRVYIDRERVR